MDNFSDLCQLYEDKLAYYIHTGIVLSDEPSVYIKRGNKWLSINDKVSSVEKAVLERFNENDYLKEQIVSLKKEKSQLLLDALLQRSEIERYRREQNTETNQNTMACIKTMIVILCLIISIGLLPRASAFSVFREEKSTAESYMEMMYDTASDFYAKTKFERSSSPFVEETIRRTKKLVESTTEKFYDPAKEVLTSYFDTYVSADGMFSLLSLFITGNGFYFLQVTCQILLTARTWSNGGNITAEACILLIALLGGYGFVARSALLGAMSPVSAISLVLAAVGNWDCAMTALLLQLAVFFYMMSTGYGQEVVTTDKDGNEKKITLGLRQWMLALVGDTVCIGFSVLIMQIHLTLFVLVIFLYATWYAMQFVETKDYTYDADGTSVHVRGRRTRRGYVPFVAQQKKRALGSIVTERVYEASFPIRSVDGNVGQAFLYAGKLCVLKHVTLGKLFSIQCAGAWIKVATKLQKELDIGHGQFLLCYAPPQEMAGKRHCKHTEVRETGWAMIGYINPETQKREVQCAYLHYADPQFSGAYDHMPGMSGAPVFNGDGRLVAVHYAANGLTGLSLQIPTIVDEPRAINPDAELITRLNKDYQDEEDLKKKQELKVVLGAVSKGQMPESADAIRALRSYGHWSFDTDYTPTQQRKSGYLDDHHEPASKAWVTMQLKDALGDIEERFLDGCWSILHDEVQQGKSLKKSKGMKKAYARATNSGGTIDRHRMRRAARQHSRKIGKQFTEGEYEELLKEFSPETINKMAYERYCQLYGEPEVEETYAGDSDESQTYGQHDGLWDDYHEQFLATSKQLTNATNKIEDCMDRIKSLESKESDNKLRVNKVLRRIKRKLKPADQEQVDQLLRVDIQEWSWNEEDKPTVKVETHVMESSVEEMLACEELVPIAYASTSMMDDKCSVNLLGARLYVACPGCSYCSGTKEQASKRQPMRTKCGQLTTCYNGHIRHCKADDKCKDTDTFQLVEICKNHCNHYWCHKENAANGNPCTNPNCKNPYIAQQKKPSQSKNCESPAASGLAAGKHA